MTREPGVGRSGAQSDEGDGAARWRAPIPAFPPSRSPTMTPLRRRMIVQQRAKARASRSAAQTPRRFLILVMVCKLETACASDGFLAFSERKVAARTY